MRSQRLSAWAWGIAALVLALLLVLVWGLNMRRGLNHDEHQFVASGALIARDGLLPYRDFPYFHVPTLSFRLCSPVPGDRLPAARGPLLFDPLQLADPGIDLCGRAGLAASAARLVAGRHRRRHGRAPDDHPQLSPRQRPRLEPRLSHPAHAAGCRGPGGLAETGAGSSRSAMAAALVAARSRRARRVGSQRTAHICRRRGGVCPVRLSCAPLAHTAGMVRHRLVLCRRASSARCRRSTCWA